jgi:hypothetical protein
LPFLVFALAALAALAVAVVFSPALRDVFELVADRFRDLFGLG